MHDRDDEPSIQAEEQGAQEAILQAQRVLVDPAAAAEVGAGAAWLLVDYSIRPYRERAATYDLDKIDDLEVPSLILDRNGHEIGRIFVENRSVIRFADIPQRMIDALKAGEDRRFDHHNGVDYIGIVRAFYENWQAGETTQAAARSPSSWRATRST